MLRKNTFLLMIIVCGLVVAIWFTASKKDVIKKVTISPDVAAESGAGQRIPQSNGSRDRNRRNKAGIADLEKYLAEWDSIGTLVQGDELIRKRTALIFEARKKLQGEELARFLDAVIKRGNYQAYAAPVVGAAYVLFSDADEALQNRLASEWLSGISNAEAREELAFHLGKIYKGDNIGVLLDQFADLKTKKAVLNAFCVEMAGDNPCNAFRVYQANLPQGGDYSGLAMIAANMKTDFRDFIAMLPSDERSLTSKARDQALQSWGRQNPLDAANFVRENPDKIQPSYMKSVISTWMESDPDAAIAWAQKEQDPVYKANSFRGIVDSWKGSEPEKAWNLIINESGIDSAHDELLKRIHAEWIKTDPKAAEAARVHYQTLLDNR